MTRMKKMLPALLAFCALLLVSGAQAETTTTVMMYMCGTDLQEDCVRDMYEMCAVDLPDSVQVVVQAGGASEWADDELTPYALNRFTIGYDAFNNIETLPGNSMGDSNTLFDFLNWAVSDYPAERYILILWDHGGGSDAGVCFDETADNDGLTIHEIYDTLYNYYERYPDFRLDIIGCDACLMATYEMAAHMAYYADYMVASEELEPWLGWNYTGWLSKLAENPDMDSQAVAVAIADAYMEACLEDNPNDYVSQSVIYLPAMFKLCEYMETYAAYLTQALEDGQIATISRARQRMYSFGDFNDASSANNMVDFMAFLDATRSFAPNTAELVESAYQRAVRYSVGTDVFDYLTGLSIFLPYKDIEWTIQNFVETYSCGETIPNYSEFVYGYACMLAGGDYNFDVQAPSQLDSEVASSGTFIGNMTATIFTPTSDYTVDEDTEAFETDDEDVTTDLPEAVSSLAPSDNVVIGGIMPVQSTEEASTPAGDEVYACTMTLSSDEIANLSMVEGMLFMDISDEETTAYVEMGTMQNAYVNWGTGEIASGFDGTWPMLDEQIVAMFDQIVTSNIRRSYITVKCNDEEGFLLLTFNNAHPEGVISGFTKGFDENGLPVRGATRLQEGDTIIPTYTLLYDDGESDELQESTFEGDPIVVGEDGTLSFDFLPLEGAEIDYLYCFCFTDIYGNTQLSDFISFTL